MSQTIAATHAITQFDSAVPSKKTFTKRTEWILPLSIGLFVATAVYGTVLHHYLAPPTGMFFSGAIQYDQPYYMVMSRAALELGNGLIYPNPFSVTIGTPIYSHLFMLIVAHIQNISRLPFDWVFQAAGAAATVSMFLALYYLVASVQSDKTLRQLTFAACALAGSVGWIPAIFDWLRLGHSPSFSFAGAALSHVYEKGQWLDSVPLTSVYPTESFYHVVMFLALGALVARRTNWLTLFAGLVWWAHPFYGLELTLIVGIAMFLELAFSSDRKLTFRTQIKTMSPTLVVLCAGLAYNLLYLSRFPEHLSVVEFYRSQQYKITTKYYPIHYHLYCLLPIVATIASAKSRSWLFKTTVGQSTFAFFLGTLLLMNNNYFVQCTQPAHFARGYLLVSLCLLTFSLANITNFPSSKIAKACLCAVLIFSGVPDNLMILNELVAHPPSVAWLPNDTKQMVDILKDDKSNPLIAASEFYDYDTQMYLMREAKIRSFVSHCATPYYPDRIVELMRFYAGTEPEFLDKYSINYVLANSRERKLLQRSGEIKRLTAVANAGDTTLFKVAR